ncbi:MAG: poly-gamma-glutamate system protein [Candidatus Stahlbacteria bacterium]|nr:poly-gamma-glutamate system protein [Candidatus Stahlbacteria bacterium]
MRWRAGKIPIANVVALAIFAILIYAYVEKTKQPERSKYYSYKIKAARLMDLFEHTIKEKKEFIGLVIDEVNDPNQTGIIGPEFTIITTDRGDLTAKLTASNPNFAAVIVDMLKSCKLKKGDIIAIGETGSLVGLNLAVYAAIEAMELKPIIITSLGASSWGATDTEFTWLDIAETLKEKGLIHFYPVAASIGGGGDIGRGLTIHSRELLKSVIRRNKVDLIEENTLEESINKRMKIYDTRSKGKRIKAYINIGGGIASLGSTQNGKIIPPGVSKRLGMKNFPAEGVIIKMSKRGLPIIQLLNVDIIARRYKLPIAPIPLPEIGEGTIFFKIKYNVAGTILAFIILCILTFLLLRVDIWYYFMRKREKKNA